MTEKTIILGSKFDIHDYAGVVPMASDLEQRALNDDIARNGLREPLIIWRDKIVDGRCRQIGCLLSDTKIRYKELDSNMTDDEVIAYVKSVNTRRNLTSTQKVMAAVKQYLNMKARGEKIKTEDLAKSWGFGRNLISNGLYIAVRNPEYIEPLFNGRALELVTFDGKQTTTSKITTIYSILKKLEENAVEDNTHAWDADSAIKTQLGREWYLQQMKELDVSRTRPRDLDKIKMNFVELANYKFKAKS